MTAPGGGGGLFGKIKGLFGAGSTAQQFFVWGVLQSVANAITSPFTRELTNVINEAAPFEPIPPDTAATMVVRNVFTHDRGAAEAAKNGLDRERFDRLVDNNGEPPSLGDLLSLWRRGKIDTDRLVHGIRQSRIRDEWTGEVKELGVIPPSPVNMLDALLKGQISEDDAKAKYRQLGGDPEYFTILFNSQGSAPTPVQAADMANRGIIPWTGHGPGSVSFDQAFLEGPWRNKWQPAFKRAAEYLPPPETVRAMLRRGAISETRAKHLLAQNGLTPETTADYLADAKHDRIAAQKDLAASQIITLYADKAITHADAESMLSGLGYSKDEADFIILISDMKRVIKFTEAAIGAVHAQYVGHRIDAKAASTALDSLGVPSTQRDDLIALWNIERKARIVTLTAAQIKAAHKKDLITEADALHRLENHGYSATDAAIFLKL